MASCLGVAATLLLPLPPPPFDLEESLCWWRSAPNPEEDETTEAGTGIGGGGDVALPSRPVARSKNEDAL